MGKSLLVTGRPVLSAPILSTTGPVSTPPTGWWPTTPSPMPAIRQPDSLRDGPIQLIHANICDYDRVLQTMREHAVDTVVHFCRREPCRPFHSWPRCLYRDQCGGHPPPAEGCAEVWLGVPR